MGTFVRYGVFVAIQGLWAGPYLMEGLGLSPVAAGNFILLVNIGYLVGSPLSGWLSDRVIGSPKRVVLLGIGVKLAALFALSMGWGEGHFIVLGLILLTFGTFSSSGIVMYAHIKSVMPLEMAGMATTGINFFTMLGGAVFMQTMGWILDTLGPTGAAGTSGYHIAFFVVFIALGIAFAGYLFTREATAVR
jgi:sugar phosphate permease